MENSLDDIFLYRKHFVQGVVDIILLSEAVEFLSGLLDKEILADPGQDYIRLYYEENNEKMCYCFLDYEGNMYSPASWDNPTELFVGNIIWHIKNMK